MKNPILKKQKLDFSVTRIPNSDIVKELPISRQSVWNTIDDFAASVSLQRLPEETNLELYERIFTKVANPFNSTREGLTFVIPAELGLNSKDVLEIECTNSNLSSYNVIFDGVSIKVYSIYLSNDNFSLLADIPLIHQDYITIQDVASAIDSLNDFSCTVLDEELKYFPALWLASNSFQKFGLSLIKNGAIVTNLEHVNIVPGSLLFNSNSVLQQEVATIGEVSGPGKYFVSEINGQIITYDVANADIPVYYKWIDTPLRIRLAGVSLITLEQATMYEDFYDGNLPTDKLTSYINSIKNVTHQNWAS